MVSYEKALSCLKLKEEIYQKDVEILKKVAADLRYSNENDAAFDFSKYESPINVLEKYDYLKFIDSIFSKEKLIFIIKKMCENNIKLKFSYKIGEIENIKISNEKFENSISFMTTLKILYIILQKKRGYKVKRGKVVFKNTKSSDKKDVEFLFEILAYYNTDFYDTISRLINKITVNLDKISNLINIIENLKRIDINLNTELFKENLDKYSKAIRNDELFKNDDLNSLNLELREEYRLAEKNKSRKKESQDNAAAIIKLGKREDRKAMYQKNKLFLEIGALKEELNEDSKTWVELILEQIKEDSDSFVQNPSMYLPGFKEDQSCLIKDIVLKELMYNDADEKIINALKNI